MTAYKIINQTHCTNNIAHTSLTSHTQNTSTQPHTTTHTHTHTHTQPHTHNHTHTHTLPSLHPPHLQHCPLPSLLHPPPPTPVPYLRPPHLPPPHAPDLPRALPNQQPPPPLPNPNHLPPPDPPTLPLPLPKVLAALAFTTSLHLKQMQLYFSSPPFNLLSWCLSSAPSSSSGCPRRLDCDPDDPLFLSPFPPSTWPHSLRAFPVHRGACTSPRWATPVRPRHVAFACRTGYRRLRQGPVPPSTIAGTPS